MKKQLMLCNTILIAVGFLIAFLVAGFLVQYQYEREFQRRLDAVLAVLSCDFTISQDAAQAFAENAAQSLADEAQNIRITVLDETGAVLGDSAKKKADASLSGSHSERPEIAEAREKGNGYDTRTSESTGVSYFYAAKQVPGGYLRAALSMEEERAALRSLWAGAAFSMLAGIALVCAVTIVFVYRITEPVGRISEAAKRIAAGNYASRVEGQYVQEFAELAESFNAMADNTETAFSLLRAKQDQLEAVLQGMGDGVLAVDERNRLLFLNQKARSMLRTPGLASGRKLEGTLFIRRLAELMRGAALDGQTVRDCVAEEAHQYDVYAAPMEDLKTRAALLVLTDVTHVKRLEQLRSEFVANVTHELKTPLTSIRGSIELLKSADRDEETRRYFYDVLDIEAERLYHLIEDMLILSQIESARSDPDRKPCSVCEALAACLERARPAAEKGGVSLVLEDGEDVLIQCTPPRLQQLLGNLIDNAVKYNREGGDVTVSVQNQRQTAVIKVKDTGIGIAPEHIPRLFERFYRVDTSRSREIGGTGLGLSIVKHLVQLYGGDIGVESEPGKGTVFTIFFPAG